MPKLTVSLANQYPIVIKAGLLQHLDLLAEQLPAWVSRHVLIVDETIYHLYGVALYEILQKYLNQVDILALPSGEINKTRQTKQYLEDELLALGCDKNTCLLALGGGVTTDIVGFVAATLYRGVAAVYIPTTLLSMVDASIGGKTAVNTHYGKNLIGQFYHPYAVLIDPNVLQTLSHITFAEGMAEVIKHALIGHGALWSLLDSQAEHIQQLDMAYVIPMIEYSLQVKRDLVEQDEKERKGPRQLLNLGHTVAHAIELISNYQIQHGQAVAIGLVVEAHIAVILGIAMVDLPNQIVDILQRYNLPVKLPSEYDLVKLVKAMYSDKKNQNQAIHCCLLRSVAQPYIVEQSFSHAISEDVIYQALELSRG